MSRQLPSQAVCELFDFLEDVVFWIKDRAGRYQWVNVTNFLNLGLGRREDVLGKTDFDLLPAHLAAQFRADDERVLRGQAIANRIELIGGFDHPIRSGPRIRSSRCCPRRRSTATPGPGPRGRAR